MPDAIVTENWSDRKFKAGVSANRGFVVTGPTNEADALVALYAAKDVDVDAAHPWDNRLRADVADGSMKGPLAFLIQVPYIAPDSGSNTKDPDNPLDRTPKYRWTVGNESAPTDVDADGIVFLNAAGFPLEGGATDDRPFDILTVTRWQSSLDADVVQAYRATTNNAPLTIPMFGTMAKGEVVIPSITTSAQYDINTRYLPVDYTLWIRRGRATDGDNYSDAWKHRLLNVGRVGWWDDSGVKRPGPFVTAKGAPIDDAIRLDVNGLPLNTTFKVDGGTGGTVVPKSAVAAPDVVSPTLFEVGSDAVYLKRKRFKPANFSALSLF